MSVARPLPNIGHLLRPLAEKIPAEQRPLFVALVERMAAQRYREWADGSSDTDNQREFRACADREEEIAVKVESLYPNAPEVQSQIRAAIPDLEEVVASVYEGLDILDQYIVQSEGERIGAATWRGFAEKAEPKGREVFLACALLEEKSAEVLEEILEAGG